MGAKRGCRQRFGHPALQVGRNASAFHPKPSHAVRVQGVPQGGWRQSQKPRASVIPEVATEAAKKKVSGLEAALAALAVVGATDGPEVQALRESLQKAKGAAQERPVEVQVRQSEAFVERARKRLAVHDAERHRLAEELEESEARLGRLREVAAQAPAAPLPDLGTQVQNLRQLVNWLQEERDAMAQELHGIAVERPRARQRTCPPHVLRGSDANSDSTRVERMD